MHVLENFQQHKSPRSEDEDL